ncbi:putative WEB family protein [Helianthus annuus]|nr:putative WEB family protein [Helianthus annuus]
MAAQGPQNKTDSPKVEVGEIDTSSPIRSVKDAVNLFGEGAFSGERITVKKTKARSTDRVLKETKFHLAQKEIYKLKEQLKSAETTKSGALTELEQAKRTVDDLTKQLEVTNKAKEAAMKAAMNQAKQFESGVTNINDGLKQDLENTKQQYAAVFTELDAAKQELRRIRHDHETAIKEQNAAIKRETESELMKNVSLDRTGEKSKEIMSVQETNEQEQEKAFAEKNVQKLAHKAALKESAKKLLALREQVNPQREMENARALDLDSLKTVTLGLDGAKDSLQKVFEEESWLKKLLEGLKTELENIRKEHKELKEKETETVVGNRNSKLPDASDETMLTFQQMISENENAKRESEEMKKKAEELKKEAEAMRVALEEAESKLKIALTEVDEAKKAEIKVISERTDAAHASSSESSGSKIVISREEFEALSRKVIESEKLEATQKEILDLKAATETAMKRAEAAETCKKAAEGELKRWREREQKKAAEAVALILQETQMQQTQSLPSTPNHKQSSSPRQKMKKVLISNLSSLFHRKKSQVDAGSSPSYLPGEKPV